MTPQEIYNALFDGMTPAEIEQWKIDNAGYYRGADGLLYAPNALHDLFQRKPGNVLWSAEKGWHDSEGK